MRWEKNQVTGINRVQSINKLNGLTGQVLAKHAAFKNQKNIYYLCPN
jgi:hypothetical protein